MAESSKNYKADGGDKWVIGGTLEALPEAEIVGIGGDGVVPVQTTGQSITDVMSQKATTDMIKDPTSTASTNVKIDSNMNQSSTTVSTVRIGCKTTTVSAGTSSIFIVGAPNQAGTSANVGIGLGAQANTSSIGIGVNAKATGQYSVAVGDNSNATANYSVAVGRSSLADEPGTFSVGKGDNDANVGLRRIVNVKNPINPQDAATKNYIDIRVPVPPSTGTFTLQCTEGVTSWVPV